MVLKGRLLDRADRSRGRFRSLVLKTLQDFLRDAAAKRNTRKRGGDVQIVSWDDWMAEAPSHLSIPPNESERWPAERIFDVLSGCLEAERKDVSYSKFSKTLGIPEAPVKRLVHELRRRYRSLLREEVAQTVEGPDEIDDELRYLCAALIAAE